MFVDLLDVFPALLEGTIRKREIMFTVRLCYLIRRQFLCKRIEFYHVFVELVNGVNNISRNYEFLYIIPYGAKVLSKTSRFLFK